MKFMVEREFSAGGIVIKKGRKEPKFLLIKDSYGHWTWPKGHVDKGESATEAAIREVEEETGLGELEVISQIGKSQYFYRLKGKLIFKTVYIYLFRLKKNQRLKVQTKEIKTARWFSSEKALERVDYKGTKEILKKAITVYLKSLKNQKKDSILVYRLSRKSFQPNDYTDF